MAASSEATGSDTLVPPSEEDPWTAAVWDNLRVYAQQLSTVGGAAAIAKTTVAPLERIKLLLQTQPMSSAPSAERYTGLRDAWKRLPEREGARALWRGNGANVIRLVPEIGLRYVLNDQLETLFSPIDGTPPTLYTHTAAGAATGVLKTLVCHPFDVVYARMAADSTPQGRRRLYSGIGHCFLHTARRDGLRTFYNGYLASTLGVVPYMATSFTVFHELSSRLPSDRSSRNSWWFPVLKVALGATAGTFGQAVAYPIDTVRRRMQLSGAQGQAICYSGYWHCIRSMMQQEGLRGFYRGVGVNCLKAMPGATVQFLAFDALRTGMIAFTHTTI